MVEGGVSFCSNVVLFLTGMLVVVKSCLKSSNGWCGLASRRDSGLYYGYIDGLPVGFRGWWWS